MTDFLPVPSTESPPWSQLSTWQPKGPQEKSQHRSQSNSHEASLPAPTGAVFRQEFHFLA